MAWVVNHTEHLIHLGVGVPPGVPTEVDDEWGTNDRVKELMEAGDLETVSGPEAVENDDPAEHQRRRQERRDARIEGREERKATREA